MNNMNLLYYVKEESVVCTILGHKHLRLETIYNVYTVNKNVCLGERDQHFPWILWYASYLKNLKQHIVTKRNVVTYDMSALLWAEGVDSFY